MGARCTRKCVRVCLSVFLVCTRVSVPKTSFNASDPTLGWAQWFLLCPVQGRVPVNLFLLVCCVYTKPVFLVLAFRCYKKKKTREKMSRGSTRKRQKRESERETLGLAHASWSLLRSEREDVTLTCVSVITVAHVAAFSLASETKRA